MFLFLNLSKSTLSYCLYYIHRMYIRKILRAILNSCTYLCMKFTLNLGLCMYYIFLSLCSALNFKRDIHAFNIKCQFYGSILILMTLSLRSSFNWKYLCWKRANWFCFWCSMDHHHHHHHKTSRNRTYTHAWRIHHWHIIFNEIDG